HEYTPSIEMEQSATEVKAEEAGVLQVSNQAPSTEDATLTPVPQPKVAPTFADVAPTRIDTIPGP
ncbi:unnamed protein product, partial [Ilex paraguariensis]